MKVNPTSKHKVIDDGNDHFGIFRSILRLAFFYRWHACSVHDSLISSAYRCQQGNESIALNENDYNRYAMVAVTYCFSCFRNISFLLLSIRFK